MKIILIQEYTQNLLAVTVVSTLNIRGIPDFVYFTVKLFYEIKCSLRCIIERITGHVSLKFSLNLQKLLPLEINETTVPT